MQWTLEHREGKKVIIRPINLKDKNEVPILDKCPEDKSPTLDR